jgi:YbgC/YbaW family acyl-CoA thioester hydrolase
MLSLSKHRPREAPLREARLVCEASGSRNEKAGRMRSFACPIRVRFADTDAFGIVYYPNIFRYFDHAVETLLGTSPHDYVAHLKASGAGFPALEAGGAFSAPIFAGDDITVETDVEDVRTRAFRVRHRIVRGGELLATGFEVRIYARRRANGEGIEGLPLPEDLRAYLGADDVDPPESA